MEIFDAINNRRSTRSFLDKPVEEEKLNKVLEAATKAPSAGNTQSWEFVVVKDQEPKKKVLLAKNALGQHFIAEAPVIIIVCANKDRSAASYGDRGKSLYCIQDCAAATMNLMLAAHSLGLSTCWVGAFNEAELSKALELPEHIRPLTIIPLGYSDEKPEMPPRKPLEEVVHEEKY